MKPTKDVPTGDGSSAGTFLLLGGEDTHGCSMDSSCLLTRWRWSASTITTKACSSQALLAVVGSRPSWPVCQMFNTNLGSFLPLLLFLSVQGRGEHFHTSFFQHLSGIFWHCERDVTKGGRDVTEKRTEIRLNKSWTGWTGRLYVLFYFCFFPFFLKKLNKFSLFPNIHQMSFHAKQQSQRRNHRVQASHLKGTFLARAVLSSHCDGWCLLSFWQEPAMTKHGWHWERSLSLSPHELSVGSQLWGLMPLSRPILPFETPVWSLVWVPLPGTGGPPFSSRWTWHWWDAPPCRPAVAAGPAHPALAPRWAEGQNKGRRFKTQLQRHNFLESATQHLSLCLSILPLGL